VPGRAASWRLIAEISFLYLLKTFAARTILLDGARPQRRHA
jgi:hypothetical protein